MHPFWDRTIAHLFWAFRDSTLVGREDFAWWLDRAIAKDLFSLGALRAQTLAVIVFGSRPESAPHQLAAGLLTANRKFQTYELAKFVGGMPQPLNAEFRGTLIEASFEPAKEIAHLVFRHVFEPRFRRYISRVFWEPEADASARFSHFLEQCLQEMRSLQMDDLREYLLKLASRLKIRLPGSIRLAGMSGDERIVLQRAGRLSPFRRKVLYLNLYAGATCQEIAGAFEADLGASAMELIAGELVAAWEHIFRTF
jgi:hypothetical protein